MNKTKITSSVIGFEIWRLKFKITDGNRENIIIIFDKVVVSVVNKH